MRLKDTYTVETGYVMVDYMQSISTFQGYKYYMYGNYGFTFQIFFKHLMNITSFTIIHN